MTALPVVLIHGDLGAGKTRLLAGLAEQWLPGGAVGALLATAGPIHLDPLWLPADLVVGLVDEQTGCGGGDHCGCGDDHCAEEPMLEDLGLLEARHGVTHALVELAAHQDGRGLRDVLRRRADRHLVTVAVVGAEDETRTAAQESWLLEADAVALANESCLAALPGALRSDVPVRTIAEWLAAPEALLACGRPGVPEPTEAQEHDAACGCGAHHHHHHDGDGDGDEDPESLPGRRVHPVWMPFWLESGLPPKKLARAVAALPPAARRVKAVTVDTEGEIGLVDRQNGVLRQRTIAPADPPLVFEPGALGEDEESPALPFEEGTLVLCWVPDPERSGLLDLELAVHRALAPLDPLPKGEEALAQAMTLMEEDAVVEAIACARAALSEAPEDPMLLELLAKGYHHLGENGRALALLGQAHGVGPGYASAWLNAARLHLAYGEVAAAVVTGERGLSLDPEDPDGQAVLGEALAHAGREAEGTALLEAASAGQPDDDKLHRLLVQLHLGAGNAPAALPHAEALVSLLPEDDGAQFLVGELLLQLGRDAAAFQALATARELGNETPWVLCDLAIVSHRLGDAAAAAEYATQALALSEEAWEETPDEDAALDLLLAEVLNGTAPDVRGRGEALVDLAPQAFARLLRLLALAPGLGSAEDALGKLSTLLLGRR